MDRGSAHAGHHRLSKSALFIGAALLAALPGAAFAERAAEEKGVFSIAVENDCLSSGADRNYTSGIKLAYVSPSQGAPSWLGWTDGLTQRAVGRSIRISGASASANPFSRRKTSPPTPRRPISIRTPAGSICRSCWAPKTKAASPALSRHVRTGIRHRRPLRARRRSAARHPPDSERARPAGLGQPTQRRVRVRRLVRSPLAFAPGVRRHRRARRPGSGFDAKRGRNARHAAD